MAMNQASCTALIPGKYWKVRKLRNSAAAMRIMEPGLWVFPDERYSEGIRRLVWGAGP
jgi:hypothetical protein